MYFGIADMYKIGIGPSSSHTFGPMVAAGRFIDELKRLDLLSAVKEIRVELHGSLSLTGKGHLTDYAVILGLSGYNPESVPVDEIESIVSKAKESKKIEYNDLSFKFKIEFIDEKLPLHENGIVFTAFSGSKELLNKVYYSVGGGFVKSQEEFEKPAIEDRHVPYEFKNADDLLKLCSDKRISELLIENEIAVHGSIDNLKRYVLKVWNTMRDTVERGMNREGYLPKPTAVKRRAKRLYSFLKDSDKLNQEIAMIKMNWVNLFAISTAEENAAGGRVVTAPTNGSCGVVPAVLLYYDKFIKKLTDDDLVHFFVISSAIGSLFKMNASIAGAEVGCQGEIGVASSMAAAGLTELFNASNEHILIAAEIAMEHHLGLTCDPVNGQVQIPCIERNAIAAVTAINSTAMALVRDPANAKVSLDEVIEAMKLTGKDMDPKYRETSCGGLAVVVL
ncbi:L-serine ammonia-lyase [Hippea alviniae]|uniref:L-serine ammonia-lyase n=1 Tax=Hippea alviniae TaxID=1279027 RepID=UPI0003B700C8|nr:L-serine ammonia-lyase [Hippea alviniae]